ncbi:MAG: hypothetical protein HIU84_03810 [Acidobacteria bacterium]|nr:hypothetical protein [Acidobacteriota bacterium]
MKSAKRGVIGGLQMLAPLSVEDERSLYPLIQRGRDAAASLADGGVEQARDRRLLLRQRHDGQEAESLLLRATCGLVRTRVLERGYRFGNEELEAAGVEGLVNALRRFDPNRGTRFSTYANYWIMKLVNQAIQQQVGFSDTEMRLVLKLQKFERSNPGRKVTKREVAQALGVSPQKANEVIQMNREFVSRRFESTDFSEVAATSSATDIGDAPPWVIDELRRVCGDDFDSFWQFTFRTMSLEEIATSHAISRQGMSKRIERCRRAVRESPEATRLQAWLDRQ